MERKYLIVALVVIIAIIAVIAYAMASSDSDEEIKSSSIDVDKTISMPEIDLRIFGNVNEDDSVDSKDVDALKSILKEESPQTYFADINQDGKLSYDDVTILESIIKGESNTLYYINYNLDVASVHIPVGTINVVYYQVLDAIVAMGAFDKVVAVDEASYNYGDSTYKGITSKINMGAYSTLNAEDLMATGAKVTVTGSSAYYMDGIENTLMDGYDVVRLCNSAGAMGITWHVTTLGYILGCEDGAAKYVDWFNSLIDSVENGLPSDKTGQTAVATYVMSSVVELLAPTSGVYEATVIAGLNNLESGYTSSMYDDQADAQGIYAYNPDWLIVTCGKTGMNTNQDGLIQKYEDWMTTWKIDETLSAVANGQSIGICYNLLNGMMLPLGTVALATIIYPDDFASVDIMELIQDYYNTFTLMDVDVTEGGWIYIP